MSLAFLLVATFLIVTFFTFLLCLHTHIQNRHVSSYFLSCWILVCGKPTAWLFNSLLPGDFIPGDQTKKVRDVTAAYLLYRCKHLYMLIYGVVFLSLTK